MLAVAIYLPLRFLARVIDVGDVHHPLAKIERRLDRVGEARALRFAHDQAIDDDFDQMLAAMIDLRRRIDVERLAVNAHAHEAGAANLVEDGVVFLLAAPFD
ncbi:MAG TPA: hypothetical protein VKE42_10090, partial [Candidatus Cybelea sp.]|nr:hypothetical protein [Candidatus Cybelea sp.]